MLPIDCNHDGKKKPRSFSCYSFGRLFAALSNGAYLSFSSWQQETGVFWVTMVAYSIPQQAPQKKASGPVQPFIMNFAFLCIGPLGCWTSWAKSRDFKELIQSPIVSFKTFKEEMSGGKGRIWPPYAEHSHLWPGEAKSGLSILMRKKVTFQT